ncbi:MAG: CADD family putative folate metabolism protein [Bacteroidetes bacterium]|nr:CADD family putative folate metabolism protein [Bacteroidota bacterium]
MTSQEFLERLDAIVNERHMLQHPFYIMWNNGELSLEMLREYAHEYYLQVHNFPTYVSATHANCDDFEVRQMLLENLIEEEHGPNNHPELWRRFADSLGIQRSAIVERKYLPHTKDSVRILKELSARPNAYEGIAALYAYESQIPEVSTTKIEGLKKHYNLDTKDALEFFEVHEHADEIHRTVTREALARLCQTDNEKEAALDAAREAADALNLLLDGVYENYCSKHLTAM